MPSDFVAAVGARLACPPWRERSRKDGRPNKCDAHRAPLQLRSMTTPGRQRIARLIGRQQMVQSSMMDWSGCEVSTSNAKFSPQCGQLILVSTKKSIVRVVAAAVSGGRKRVHADLPLRQRQLQQIRAPRSVLSQAQQQASKRRSFSGNAIAARDANPFARL